MPRYIITEWDFYLDVIHHNVNLSYLYKQCDSVTPPAAAPHNVRLVLSICSQFTLFIEQKTVQTVLSVEGSAKIFQAFFGRVVMTAVI